MTDLVSRLRELANHRSSILGKRPEEMEEWMAADEIESLRRLVRDAFNEGFGEGMKEFTKHSGGNGWQDSRARARLKGVLR